MHTFKEYITEKFHDTLTKRGFSHYKSTGYTDVYVNKETGHVVSHSKNRSGWKHGDIKTGKIVKGTGLNSLKNRLRGVKKTS